MIKFKDLLLTASSNHALEAPSVGLSHRESGRRLELRFDSKDVLRGAGYTGAPDLWLEALLACLTGLTFAEAQKFSWESFDRTFGEDPFYWEEKAEAQEKVFFWPLELLRATLDLYRGRETLYGEFSPLICRCFGVRETDVLEFLRKDEVLTLEKLAQETKASMGCRSCLPQLKKLLNVPKDPEKRLIAGRSKADWILRVDEALSLFPFTEEWKLQVEEFNRNTVIISFEKAVTQKEEETLGRKLQGFLGSETTPELAFFLRRR